ncbi:hypothetical protein SKAU_G00203160 [Synaphobranchus kaupii]|uniref:Uncharacterized protein n=1 Tax=Synaphobranchus kaupii TaxID=118154 RepID=A0A9Q1FFV7_SYNKA|nr:hypothetical protein SKAU_G00203160 [Synaphobranchus kaupii]
MATRSRFSIPCLLTTCRVARDPGIWQKSAKPRDAYLKYYRRLRLHRLSRSPRLWPGRIPLAILRARCAVSIQPTPRACKSMPRAFGCSCHVPWLTCVSDAPGSVTQQRPDVARKRIFGEFNRLEAEMWVRVWCRVQRVPALKVRTARRAFWDWCGRIAGASPATSRRTSPHQLLALLDTVRLQHHAKGCSTPALTENSPNAPVSHVIHRVLPGRLLPLGVHLKENKVSID